MGNVFRIALFIHSLTANFVPGGLVVKLFLIIFF